jgi:hypothetical protein
MRGRHEVPSSVAIRRMLGGAATPRAWNTLPAQPDVLERMRKRL